MQYVVVLENDKLLVRGSEVSRWGRTLRDVILDLSDTAAEKDICHWHSSVDGRDLTIEFFVAGQKVEAKAYYDWQVENDFWEEVKKNQNRLEEAGKRHPETLRQKQLMLLRNKARQEATNDPIVFLRRHLGMDANVTDEEVVTEARKRLPVERSTSSGRYGRAARHHDGGGTQITTVEFVVIDLEGGQITAEISRSINHEENRD